MQAQTKISTINEWFGVQNNKVTMDKFAELVKQASITKLEGMLTHYLITEVEDKVKLKAAMQTQQKNMSDDKLKAEDINPQLINLMDKALKMRY
jgi:hypothetical protein